MTRRTNQRIADMGGVAALPRKSGELVFHDPWERRVFALAVALCEQGLYKWDDFRDRLIAEIAAAERGQGTDTAASPPPTYYEHWLAAFEKLLIEKGIRLPE
ncbi:MAG: nitrile hydratase accessory protein [Deltaproteobacteria bacterium]|nr:nitrile hydratase accessory protein [Deltaproteobacteria bacterium]